MSAQIKPISSAFLQAVTARFLSNLSRPNRIPRFEIQFVTEEYLLREIYKHLRVVIEIQHFHRPRLFSIWDMLFLDPFSSHVADSVTCDYYS